MDIMNQFYKVVVEVEVWTLSNNCDLSIYVSINVSIIYLSYIPDIDGHYDIESGSIFLASCSISDTHYPFLFLQQPTENPYYLQVDDGVR